MMNLILFFTISICIFIQSSFCHVVLTHPQARTGDSGLKGPYPCGGKGFFQDGHPVTELAPGKQWITIDETIYHKGAPMRIAISKDNDDGFDEHVLLTHIPHPDNGKYSTYTIKLVVDIPDINCEKCSLQLLSVMTDKIGKGNCCSYPTDSANKCFSVYHTCANIKITGTGDTLPKSPENIDIWSYGEGSNDAYTVSEDGSTFSLTQPYDLFQANQCTCNDDECVMNEIDGNGKKIYPTTVAGNNDGKVIDSSSTSNLLFFANFVAMLSILIVFNSI